MQSRYYNPEFGRFINADAFTSTGQGLLGNNMFAYCKNNPIAFIDPDGMCTRTGYRPWLSVTLEYIDCGRSDCPTSANYKAKGNSKNKPTDTSKRDAEGSKNIWRTIYNHNIRQQDIQNQVLIKQMELIKNGGVALWDAFMRGYSIQQYAHTQETQGKVDLFATPERRRTTLILIGAELVFIDSCVLGSPLGAIGSGITFYVLLEEAVTEW